MTKHLTCEAYVMERFYKADAILKIFEKVFGDFNFFEADSPEGGYSREPYIQSPSYNGEYMEQHNIHTIERFLLMCRDRNKPVNRPELL